jgi:HAD superfamily hydrolase (TIGR01509 family)
MSSDFNSCHAVIFDMDGVITDTEPLHVEAERRTCRHFGLDVPDAEWVNFKGRTADDIFDYLMTNFGGGRGLDSQTLIAHKTATYLKLLDDGLPIIPGFLDFLPQARRRFEKVGLATSSLSSVQRAVFDRYALESFFDAVTTGDELSRGKPDPEAYLKASAKLGLAPGDCVVIEDSVSGIRAGVAAGCRVVGLATSYEPEDLLSCGAHAVARDYGEMTRLLIG